MSINSPAERVQIGRHELEGLLTIPVNAPGIVVFAHGTGSSRLSPRNTYVAKALNRHGLGTLQFDLLSEAEAADRSNVFDIDLLGERVVEAVRWLRSNRATQNPGIGVFGASTGAAAALFAAATLPGDVAAVVSRGGRPDLADTYLPQVKAPTLLIVGGNDDQVIKLNKQALERMTCEKSLLIVPGATHLFEESGALDTVVESAGEWFVRHLSSTR